MTAVDHPTDTIDSTTATILQDRVILGIRLPEAAGVVDACRAAMAGGLRILELTLTTPGALEAIAALAQTDEALVGAGTVLSAAEVRRVADAGGQFVMSPVYDPDVVKEAHRLGLLAVPGGATPKEILTAHASGARLVKFFPSGALGGPAFIRAFRGPLPHVRLVPTSGPTAETLADYLAAGAVAVGVGPEVFPPGFTTAHVEAAARRVRQAADEAPRPAH